MTRHSNVVALVLLALTTACHTNTQYFRPTELANAETPEGFTAAQYDLQVAETRWGEVRVWSEGAEVRDVDGQRDTVLHVGFEIENATEEPLALNLARIRVEDVRTKQSTFDSFESDSVDGDPSAEAHSLRQVHFEFIMPERIRPKDLQSFRVRWQLVGPGDVVYEQQTPFKRERRVRRYYEPYHPYWHSPVFFSFGYTNRWCW